MVLSACSVLVLIVWLDVEVQLLAYDFLVHHEDLLTSALEVTGGVVGGRDPESLRLDLSTNWLLDRAD